MSAIIEAKKQQVDVIAEQLKNSVSTVIVDYRGLTVAEVTDLRAQLREAGVEYKVYKNTLVRRAAEKAGIEGVDEFLTGPTAIATTTDDVVAPAKVISGFAKLREAGVEYKVYKNTLVRRAAEKAGIEGVDEFLTGPTAIATTTDDVVAPAKVISGFAKEHEALEIKTGVMEGNVISAEEVKTVGSLPSHDGLVSMLLSVLQAPVRNFAYAVKAVGEQKEESAE